MFGGIKDKEGQFDSTKSSDSSPCRKFGVVEPLVYPSMKTCKGGSVTRFYQPQASFCVRYHDMPMVLLVNSNEGQARATRYHQVF